MLMHALAILSKYSLAKKHEQIQNFVHAPFEIKALPYRT